MPPFLQENLAGVDEDLIRLSGSKALAQASATDAFSTEIVSPVMCLTVTSSLKDLEALRGSSSWACPVKQSHHLQKAHLSIHLKQLLVLFKDSVWLILNKVRFWNELF